MARKSSLGTLAALRRHRVVDNLCTMVAVAGQAKAIFWLDHLLLVVLMFAFGHRCTDDPLYPWIARTLQDERTVDPAVRAERLERKAVTWLEHVVASAPGRPQA